eukprot:478162-Pelagomonas_calceolata.AAC.4
MCPLFVRQVGTFVAPSSSQQPMAVDGESSTASTAEGMIVALFMSNRKMHQSVTRDESALVSASNSVVARACAVGNHS